LTKYNNVVRLYAYSKKNMSSLRPFNDVKSINVGSSNRVGRGRCHSDRTVTPTSTLTAPFRMRGSRLSTNLVVAPADSDNTTGAGRKLNAGRRKSLDIPVSKVYFCFHSCM